MSAFPTDSETLLFRVNVDECGCSEALGRKAVMKFKLSWTGEKGQRGEEKNEHIEILDKQRGADEFFSSSRQGLRDLAWGVDNAASLREGKSIWAP